MLHIVRYLVATEASNKPKLAMAEKHLGVEQHALEFCANKRLSMNRLLTYNIENW